MKINCTVLSRHCYLLGTEAENGKRISFWLITGSVASVKSPSCSISPITDLDISLGSVQLRLLNVLTAFLNT